MSTNTLTKSMILPVRFYTSCCHAVGPTGSIPMWQGMARVCGQTIAQVNERAGFRTERALISRLLEDVRRIDREHRRGP